MMDQQHLQQNELPQQDGQKEAPFVHDEVDLMSIDQRETIREMSESNQVVGGPATAAEKEGEVSLLHAEVKDDVPLVNLEASTGKRKRGRPPRGQSKALQSPTVNNQDDDEDVCFICFDGGSLVLCDRKGCPKAYHQSCIKRDESFFRSTAKWNCGWHICTTCLKASTSRCYTCPFSLCKRCIAGGDFFIVKGPNGFCGPCMKTIRMIENLLGEKDTVQVDFDDKTSWEYLFKVYWLYVKGKECLTVDMLANSKKLAREDDIVKSNVEWSLQPCGHSDDRDICPSTSRGDMVANQAKRRKCTEPTSANHVDSLSTSSSVQVKSLQDGNKWATQELLDFVAYVKNGDISMLSQFDVHTLMLEYVKKNNLRDPNQKSHVICDSLLSNIFQKERVGHFEMLKLLESHFLTKEKSLDTNNISREVVLAVPCPESQLPVTRKSRKTVSVRKAPTKPDEYAAIDIHNVNLIFLRRSLLEKLIDDTENFHEKVVGSIVRISTFGEDQSKEMYKLVPVVGTSKVSTPYSVGARTTNVMLEIVKLDKQEVISVEGISDQEFSEDECMQFRQSIMGGLNRRFTVGEIYAKAMALQDVKFNKEIPVVHPDLSVSPKKRETDAALNLKKQDNKARKSGSANNRVGNNKSARGTESSKISAGVFPPHSSSNEIETKNIWCYKDPSGKNQGPFCMLQLRQWSGQNYFPRDLRIWRMSEKPENSIFLTDALEGRYPKTDIPPNGTTLVSDTSVRQYPKTDISPNATTLVSASVRRYPKTDISPIATRLVSDASVISSATQNPNVDTLPKVTLSSNNAVSFPDTVRACAATPSKRPTENYSLDQDESKGNDSLAAQPQARSSLPSTNLGNQSHFQSHEVREDIRAERYNAVNGDSAENVEDPDKSRVATEKLKSLENQIFGEDVTENQGNVKGDSVQSHEVREDIGAERYIAVNGDSAKNVDDPDKSRVVTEKLKSLENQIFGEDVTEKQGDGKGDSVQSHEVRDDTAADRYNVVNGDSTKNVEDPDKSRVVTEKLRSLENQIFGEDVTEKQGDGNGDSVQSCGQNWNTPRPVSNPFNPSHVQDSNSDLVSAEKSLKVSNQNQEIHFPDLHATPMLKSSPEDLVVTKAAELIQSLSSGIMIPESNFSWSTTSSLVGGGSQWGYSQAPIKAPAEEWDLGLMTSPCLKQAATPSSEISQMMHNSPTHAASHASNWPAIVPEPDDCDESVSDLLAEVEAMESQNGLPSPTSSMRCSRGGNPNDCFSPVDELIPPPTPHDLGKNDALSSTSIMYTQKMSAGCSSIGTRAGGNINHIDININQCEPGSAFHLPPARSWSLASTDRRTDREVAQVRSNAGGGYDPSGLSLGINLSSEPRYSDARFSNGGNATRQSSNIASGFALGIPNTESRYGGGSRYPSPRDRGFQDKDSNLSRGRSSSGHGNAHGSGSYRPQPKIRVCKFYESGYCKRGASCSYWHP